VVGEKFVRAVNASIEESAALICFTASGGARMQEALYSLLQMAKTSAALARMGRRGVPLEHGVIDMVVDRREMRDVIAALLSALQNRPAA
jgi:acetyl-CoA carboxylase beta subunit